MARESAVALEADVNSGNLSSEDRGVWPGRGGGEGCPGSRVAASCVQCSVRHAAEKQSHELRQATWTPRPAAPEFHGSEDGRV